MASGRAHISLQAAAVVSGSFLSGMLVALRPTSWPHRADKIIGAMMGLSLVAVPVFLDTDIEASHLLSHFVRLYHYGHRIMPTLAVGTLGLYAFSPSKAHAAGGSWRRPLIAGLTTISLVPFTWIAMTTTNYALFGLHDQSQAEDTVDYVVARTLVARWNVLHVVRSLFPLLGAIIGGRHILKQLGWLE